MHLLHRPGPTRARNSATSPPVSVTCASSIRNSARRTGIHSFFGSIQPGKRSSPITSSGSAVCPPHPIE
jgi:hypothetical protein